MSGVDFTFNIAKGRVAEFYNRVDSNDPANSALVIVVLRTANLESDATLKDKDTLADVLSGTTDEATNANYVRKVLTDTDIAAFAPDDVNDRVDLDFADFSWGPPGPTAGDTWDKLLICYDNDTTAGTDANIIPLTAHAISVVPDGNEVQIQLPNGFYRAS